MFDKERFIEYLKDNFTLDFTTYSIIESIIDYGNKRYSHSKNSVSYFIYDLLDPICIDFEEIKQFEDFTVDYEEFKKRKYYKELIKC